MFFVLKNGAVDPSPKKKQILKRVSGIAADEKQGDSEIVPTLHLYSIYYRVQ